MHSNFKFKCASFLGLLISLTLIVITAAEASSGDTLYVQSKTTNVHVAPRGNAQHVMRLKRGHKLKELRSKGAWVKVIIYGTLGKVGWILRAHVGPQDPNEPAVPKPKKSDDSGRKSKQRTADRSSPPYLLTVSGSGSVRRYRANCRVVRGKSTVRYKFSRTVASSPKSYSMRGKAISCTVQFGQGRLNVKLKKGRQLIAARALNLPDSLRYIIRERTGSIRVRSKGPWGKARSSARIY